MVNLLRFHFYLSKKIMFIISFGFLFLFFTNTNTDTGTVIQLDLTIYSILFLISMPMLSISHIQNEQLSMSIRLFPITLKQFVQSTFLFTVILFSLVFIPLLIVISFQYTQGTAGIFKVSFVLGAFAFCLISTGGMMSAYFKHPMKYQMATSDSYFYLFFVFISHTFITLIFSMLNLMIIGALIIPVMSIWIFYKFYKASIRHFENAEF